LDLGDYYIVDSRLDGVCDPEEVARKLGGLKSPPPGVDAIGPALHESARALTLLRHREALGPTSARSSRRCHLGPTRSLSGL
jgi:hypothetical protein